ncbi:hypothetical protein RED65_06733 [Oceanobacter sp. RED65]|uniref:Transmembrane protein n=2 Tax=Bermanella marisrubri TaxID=207949 RepID=Q1N2U9_9GAMM|nr:hypothetical protein RED65_06733 [Oceanobacter sp. RED65] [Bermanella marisrubri]
MLQKVWDFWFHELTEEQWFKKDSHIDQIMTQRFKAIHQQAANSELWEWRNTPKGRLAEVLLLDQFSRNIYRDTPNAFASDTLALALAQEAIRNEYHLTLTPQERAFLYMPFMHSESLAIHEEAIKQFSEPGLENNLKFEKMHKDIIERFGRYPHRNMILGRKSTPEEIEFLKQPGSSF